MKQKNFITPESILESHRPEVRAICEELRQIVKTTVPDVLEKGLRGWHAIGYTHPKAGHFCAIFPQKDFVRFALEHGASLPDPDGLLRMPPTSGKQVRYIEIEPGQDIPENGIVALLHEAIWLRS